MSRISETERRRIFGAPCTSSNYTTYTTPWGMRVTVHKMVLPTFAAACELAKRTSDWVPRRIDSYNCRPIRGSSAWSLHSYGLAWDFFDTAPGASTDVWGATNAPSPSFRAAFKYHGFYLGAEFTSRKDYPHIEWASGKPGAVPSAPPAPDQPAPKPAFNGWDYQEEDVKTTFLTITTDSEGHGGTIWDPGFSPVPVGCVPQGADFRPKDQGGEGHYATDTDRVVFKASPRAGGLAVTVSNAPANSAVGVFVSAAPQ